MALGIVAAVLLALLLAALLVPVLLNLQLAGDSDAGFATSARIRVLGVVRIRRQRRTAPVPAAAPAGPAAATSPIGSSAAPPPRRSTPWQERARLLWDRAAVLRRVLERGAVRIEHPAGWIEYALADVAETGQFYGFVCATSVLVDPAGAVVVTPLWTTLNWLAVDLTLGARVYPLRLVLLLAQDRFARRRRARAAPGAEELRAGAA